MQAGENQPTTSGDRLHRQARRRVWAPGRVACRLLVLVLSTSAVAEVAQPVTAAVDLTPFGAPVAGSADGVIPAWSGGLTPAQRPDHVAGKHHQDPYADDRPLYTVTASNQAQYAELLTPGLQALLKTYPETFQIPVYPTRRSAAAPDWVYAELTNNQKQAQLTDSGNGVSGAGVASAFPQPVNDKGEVEPLKVLWNHLTRWRGEFVERRVSAGVVQRNGGFVLATSREWIECVYCQRDPGQREPANRLVNYLSVIDSPSRLAGSALLIHDSLNRVSEERKIWAFTPGQQRVRRAPGFDYEAPLPAADNLLTADELDMFNGAPDRYDWHFLGKRDVLIPYNNYRLDAPDLRYAELLTAGHVAPRHTRFERHRVWVIEARLREGSRHVYPRRTLYLDEDSWAIAIAELYDGRGQAWHVNLAFLKNYYEVPVLASALDVYHDLSSQRYFVALLNNEEASSFQFANGKPQDLQFTPEGLRRRGAR